MPSNAIVAREFNLRAYDTEPITQESVRRWVRGISMPDEIKMRILVSWLDLDLKQCFGSDHEPNRGAHSANGADIEPDGDGAVAQPPGARLSKHEIRILRLIEGLPHPDQKLILEMAKKLSQRAER